jgi:hypothetical protein
MRTNVVLVLSVILSACGGNSDQNQSNNNRQLFPSLLKDQRCFSDINPNLVLFNQRTLRFDSDGFISFGYTYYEDENCETLLYREDGRYSSYPYGVGDSVVNRDGTIGRELLFPDPENAGPYGTVYVITGNQLCFAENTLTITENSLSFTPTDNEGDFSGLEIDSDNCLIFIDG